MNKKSKGLSVDMVKRRRLRNLRLIGVGLLILAVLGMLICARAGGVGSWGWGMAFFEAAAVGALADWFAVTALFRKPLGLPIPHTDVVSRRKAEIGEGLADFVSTKFLQPDQLAAKLREQNFIRRFADTMAQQDESSRIADLVRRYVLEITNALNGSQLESAIEMLVRTAITHLDASKLVGKWLDLLTRNNRHIDTLNEFLGWLANFLGEKDVRDRIAKIVTKGIERESGWWRALNKVGITSWMAGEIIEKLPGMVESLRENLQDDTNQNRAAFDVWLKNTIDKLQNNPETNGWINGRIDDFMNSSEFRKWVGEVGGDARRWIHDDLAHEESILAHYLSTGIRGFAQKVQSDPGLCEEMECRLEGFAVILAPSIEDFIHKHIRQTIEKWKERDLIAALELELGPDLQYIRFNGTLVGGIIGLLLHTLVVFSFTALA